MHPSVSPTETGTILCGVSNGKDDCSEVTQANECSVNVINGLAHNLFLLPQSEGCDYKRGRHSGIVTVSLSDDGTSLLFAIKMHPQMGDLTDALATAVFDSNSCQEYVSTDKLMASLECPFDALSFDPSLSFSLSFKIQFW